jgi:hypothetical protein
MAARKNKVTLSDRWKDRIQATAIMNRLMSHVDGDLELSPTQIKAADILLKKIVPDLARQEHVGADNGPIELVVKWQDEK